MSSWKAKQRTEQLNRQLDCNDCDIMDQIRTEAEQTEHKHMKINQLVEL